MAHFPAIAGSVVICVFVPNDVSFRPEQPKTDNSPSPIPQS